MKIGIITDVHSNIVALRKVIELFEERNVEKIICCGDIVGIGPEPEQAVKLLMGIKQKLIAVRGNHENYAIKGLPKVVHDDKRPLSENEINNHLWNKSRLSKESLEFLASLKSQEYLKVNSKTIYIVHYPMVDGTEKYQKHFKKASLEECKNIFSNIEADVYLYGHTHFYNFNQENNKLYINCGSLGCKSENGCCANCGILNVEDENISFEHLCVEYDVDSVRKEIEDLKYPFYKEILKIFY